MVNVFLSDFAKKLLNSAEIIDYIELLTNLKEMGPSAIDLELRSMSIEMSGNADLLQKFLQFLLYILATRQNFELANAYLALFLKMHGNYIAQEEALIRVVEQIKEIQVLAWTNLKTNLNKNLCIVSYLKSIT